MLRRVHLKQAVCVVRSDATTQLGRTKGCQVVLEVVSEVVAFSGGLVVELDVHYVMCILVGHFDHPNHVIR